MSNQFVWKPVRHNGPNAVAVIPSQYTGQTAAVYLVDAQGNTIAQGKYRSSGNGNRGNWDFPRTGSAYGSNVRIVVKLEDGSTVGYGIPNAGSRVEARSETAPGDITGQQSTAPITQGNFVQGPGGTGVAIPDFVNFDPTQFYINYDQADARAEARADKNVDRFQENFDLSRGLAYDNLNTEISGLEAYLPRSTALIKKADAETNRDIVQYANLFDQRNQKATQIATQGNVAQRTDLVEQFAPGTFESMLNSRVRQEGDVERIRERESTALISAPLKETAARSARNTAADQGAAGGFGIDSASTRNLLDRFDFDKRLEIEQTNREDARRGDTAIQSSEAAVLNANTTAQNAFNSLIAPGIQDFQASQPAPIVTNVGAQIKASPTTDAGTIQRNLNSELVPLTTINPTNAFQFSFEEQKWNRQQDLAALQFQQQQNDITASAINTSSNLVVSEDRYNDQRELFEQALEDRRNGQDIQGGSSLITAGLGILGSLIGDYNAKPTEENRSTVGGWIDWVGGILGQDWTSGQTLQGTNGPIDVSVFEGAGNSSTGGFWENWGTGTGSSGGLQDPFSDLLTGGASSSVSGTTSNIDFSTDSNFNLDGFNWGGASKASTDTARARTLKTLNDSNFKGAGQLAETFENLTPEQTQAAYAQFDSLVAGLEDPATRDQTTAQLSEYGISPQTVTQVANLYSNWDQYSDRDRAYAVATTLNNISSSIGTGTIPVPAIAMINAIRNGAQLYSNWDNMTEGQRAAGVVNVGGSMAAAYASYTAAVAGSGASVAGPIGAAVALGFMAVARSTQVAFDEGPSNTQNTAAIANPLYDFVANALLPSLTNAVGVDAPGSGNDRSNAALLSNPVTAPLGVYSILGGDMDFTSGKPKDQQYRDAFRRLGEDPKAGGFLTKNSRGSHQLKLADGTVFDIGKDGNAKIKNYGTNIDGNKERRYSDVDWSNPVINEVVSIANPLSVLIFRSPEGKRMVGHITNALTSKSPTDLKAIKNNAKDIALQAGIDYASGVEGLKSMGLDQHTFDVYLKSWQNIMLK